MRPATRVAHVSQHNNGLAMTDIEPAAARFLGRLLSFKRALLINVYDNMHREYCHGAAALEPAEQPT